MKRFRIRNIFLSAVALTLFLPASSLFSQIFQILPGLPIKENNIKKELQKISDKEKLNMLYLLPNGERIEFSYSSYDEETEYYGLDTSGIYIIDLNFDGKKDMIYSGPSGNQGLTNSKVYLNKGGKLIYQKTMQGGLLHLEKESGKFACYTVWYPCCDSYTSLITKYSFSKTETAEKEYSISVIGLRRLVGLPDFENTKMIRANDPEIYAFPEDFRLTSPYFRDRNKHIRDSLHAGYNIGLIHLRGNIQMHILNTVEKEDKKWQLIITESLNDVPNSLYEWSVGDNRRLIGWIKEPE